MSIRTSIDPDQNRFASFRFKTNDTLRLAGGLGLQDLRTLEVNGHHAVLADRRLFVVLLILIVHALQSTRRRMPFHVPSGPSMSAKTILLVIDRLKVSHPVLFEGIFESASDQTIVGLIHDLRRVFSDLSAHPKLLETGPSNRGYRLSTPPRNLSLRELGGLCPAGGSADQIAA